MFPLLFIILHVISMVYLPRDFHLGSPYLLQLLKLETDVIVSNFT